MKNSGIEWIEGLPETWQEIPNRYLFIDHSVKVGEQWKDYQLLSLTTSGVKEKNVNAGGGKVPDSYENYQTVEIGDMIFCLFDLDCSAVFSGLSNYNGMITSAYNVFMPNSKYLNNLYADYWFQYVFSNRYYKMYSKNIRYTVTTEMFKSILTPIPPLDEQRKIGEFLLEKDKQIAELIANQQLQIEKLKEYKQSVITEAVTKGLDKNAPMKDSGVEWIGEIPTDWELFRGKVLFRQRNEKGNDVCLQLLSPTQRYGVIPQEMYDELSGMTAVKLNINTDLSTMKTIRKGDYCISLRSFQGGFEYSKYEGVVSPAYQVFYAIRELDEGYYKYLFKENGFISEMNSYTLTIRDGKNIAYADFANSYIPYPPLSMQKEISQRLDKLSEQIDRLIAIKQDKIEKLQEYKKSLIYEYVTGKKEVV